MSDDQRGAYTPPSDRLAFDPREPVRSGPPPVTLILSALVLIGLIGGVAFLYRHGIRHTGAGPAEVGQPVGEMKTPAPADANAAASTALPAGRESTNAAPAFASAPEQPLPRVNPATGIVAPPSAAGPAPQGVSASAPPPAPPAMAGAEPAKPAKPLSIASLANDAVAPPPKSKAGVTAPPKPAPKPGPASMAAPAAGWVQIGAFSSPALAAKGWSDIAKLAPAVMAGKGKSVQPVTADGTVLYRTYITGFASRDAAEAFCGKLKAAKKNCFVK